MKKCNLLNYLMIIIEEQRQNNQWGTSHVYQSTYNSFSTFIGSKDLSFSKLTPTLLKNYENHLRAHSCKWNTIATYMKVLKAVYNRALESGHTKYVPHLFKHVHTTVRNERKLALSENEMIALYSTIHYNRCKGTEKLSEAQKYFMLMFLLRGIPFVDIAYLRKSDIRGDFLFYNRRKTGRPLCVRLTPESKALIEELSDKDIHNPYLFPIITSNEGSEKAYIEYQSALRSINQCLKLISKENNSIPSISTYAARHTWATMAYYCEIHPGIISAAMGHSSITVTENYLKPFQNDKIDNANMVVLSRIQYLCNLLKKDSKI